MLPSVTGFDHLLILVRDIDRAAAMYATLGFTLTERGHHTGGTCNHTMMLDGNYLELVSVERPGPGTAPYAELLKRFQGPHAIGLATEDADAVHRDLAAMGLETAPANRFSRPVRLADGFRDASFRTVRVPKQPDLPDLFACQHLTRDVVWRPEWQQHANGAQRVVGIVIVHGEPDRAAAAWKGLFGELGASRIEYIAPEAVATRFPGCRWPAGRADGAIAGVVIESRSLPQTEALLRNTGIAISRTEAGGIVPELAATCDTVLEFRSK